MIAICSDHPFYSYDDWFISTTPCDGGIPSDIKQFTGISEQLTAGAVVHRVAAFFRAGLGDHYAGTRGRVAGQQDGMTGFGEGRSAQSVVAGGEGTRGALAVHEAFLGGAVRQHQRGRDRD